MITKRVDGSDERRILASMATDQVVLGRVAEKWRKDGMFDSRWANIVGGWCVDYHKRYHKAPADDFRGLYEAWAEKGHKDDATVELVAKFCRYISDDYERDGSPNSDYITDLAGNHFNAVALRRLAEVVQGHVDSGNIKDAMEAVGRSTKIELGVGAGVDVLQDENALREAFEVKADPTLIKYPGALGEFFDTQFGRDEFIALVGKTGSGKTWWLIDLAWMAIRQGRRVAFFEIGDMSQAQVLRRFACRATGHPLRPGPNGFVFDVPTAVKRLDGENAATVETEVRKFDGPLQWGKAWKAFNEFTKRRHKEPLLRLSCHPNSSVSVSGLVGELDAWERDGWVPDVVVLDYADLLMSPPGYDPGDREAINANWKALRGLSQRMHNLVITATQANAASYSAVTLSRSNFSDDRRKNDHVTGMLGINQTEEEKAGGIYRLNWTKRREEVFFEGRCVHVAGCLAMGRPHMKSTF